MGGVPEMVSITSGSVIPSPSPHTKQGGPRWGFGGIGVTKGAGIGVGAGVVGTKGVPTGAQPQGAIIVGRIRQ